MLVWILIVLSGSVLVCVATLYLWPKRITASPPPMVARKLLAEISPTWTTVHLAEIAPVWTKKTYDVDTIPDFKHSRITEFYKQHILGSKGMDEGKVAIINSMLSMLDKEGDCSSVVGRGSYPNEKEPEAAEEFKDTYSILGNVTLLDHTLDVAEIMAGKSIKPAVRANSIIAALVHDIGKLERYVSERYRSIEHAQTAPGVLGNIEGFISMPAVVRDVLLDAVSRHHEVNVDGSANHYLAALSHADRTARAKEIENVLRERGGQTSQTQAAAPPIQPSASSTGKTGRPKLVGIDDIDLDMIAIEIEGRINRLVPGKNARVCGAYTGSDGYVWVTTATLWQAVKAASKNSIKLQSIEFSQSDKNDYQYSVIQALIKKDAVQGDMIADGYFCSATRTTRGDGSHADTFHIPFKLKVFGLDIKAMEQRKTAQLWALIKDIRKR